MVPSSAIWRELLQALHRVMASRIDHRIGAHSPNRLPPTIWVSLQLVMEVAGLP